MFCCALEAWWWLVSGFERGYKEVATTVANSVDGQPTHIVDWNNKIILIQVRYKFN